MKTHLAILLLTASLATAAKEPPEVTSALAQAGGNRPQLEGLLKRYRSDKEKLQAAYFLIANMPLHKSAVTAPQVDARLKERCRLVLEKFEHDTQELSGEKLAEQDKQLKSWREGMRKEAQTMQWATSSPSEQLQPDIKVIDSAFLARHIDHAFKVRRNSPLAQRLKLQDFFETILPYRA